MEDWLTDDERPMLVVGQVREHVGQAWQLALLAE
jgi:hypothetical protein